MAQTGLRLVATERMHGHRERNIPAAWEMAIRGWIAWLAVGGCAPTTQKLRRQHIQSMVRRSNATHPRQWTLSVLIELCSERNWSLEYRKSMRTSLASFCEWAVQQGVMDENPAAQLPRVPGDKPRPRPAPDAVWRELLEAATPRERMMARLAGEAGMRRGEVAQCHRDDLVHDRGGWALIVQGKGNKQRVVPITDALAGDIVAFCPRGFLFPGRCDGHISPQWAGTVISDLMPPGWSMHKLRHRYASRGYAGTGNLRAVQEALGHASVATTERYTAVTRDEVRAVAEAASGRDTDPAA